MMHLLVVDNAHVPECGDPPRLTAGQDGYTSYFEGPLGDQWVYVVRDGEESVWGGDVGWESPANVSGTVWDAPERAWLGACRAAAARWLKP